MHVPEAFPGDFFDLILLSEVGYYWSPGGLDRAQRLIKAHLKPGGHLLLVHWTSYVEDYPLTGDEVHERFLECAAPELCPRSGPPRRAVPPRPFRAHLKTWRRRAAHGFGEPRLRDAELDGKLLHHLF